MALAIGICGVLAFSAAKRRRHKDDASASLLFAAASTGSFDHTPDSASLPARPAVVPALGLEQLGTPPGGAMGARGLGSAGSADLEGGLGNGPRAPGMWLLTLQNCLFLAESGVCARVDRNVSQRL
jgi:hypothetical protein